METKKPPNTATNQAFTKAIGKTIEGFEYGPGPRPKRGERHLHQWEYLHLHFTDGSMLEISTGSNASQVEEDHRGLNASEFSADLIGFFHEDGSKARPPYRLSDMGRRQ